MIVEYARVCVLVNDLTCTFRTSCYSARLSWALVLTWVSPFVQDKIVGFGFIYIYIYICFYQIIIQAHLSCHIILTHIHLSPLCIVFEYSVADAAVLDLFSENVLFKTN